MLNNISIALTQIRNSLTAAQCGDTGSCIAALKKAESIISDLYETVSKEKEDA